LTISNEDPDISGGRGGQTYVVGRLSAPWVSSIVRHIATTLQKQYSQTQQNGIVLKVSPHRVELRWEDCHD
jgi:hypothetical protein